mmetsp:Transcript_41142/g.50080  ORF Transcript_41142/g.50080 Transcript_41142/m.50080 type:complete len:87 (+) Transcript_41142:1-261(+)
MTLDEAIKSAARLSAYALFLSGVYTVLLASRADPVKALGYTLLSSIPFMYDLCKMIRVETYFGMNMSVLAFIKLAAICIFIAVSIR